VADIWGGYYYQINTIVSSWNQYCINLAKLAEYIGIDDFATVDQSATVDHNDNSLPKQNSDEIGNSYPKKDATVDQNATQQLTKTQPPTLYKENINKDKESNAGDIYKLFDENFQRITQRTRDILNDLINEYGIDKVHSALDKAIRQNKRFINYVEGILKNSDNKKQEHKPKHQTDIKIRK